MPDIQNIPTTQYVGPRIIPHLWDPILWDASTQYDALAVVQYNGVPYIARYVPPQGTLPTDTEYWVRWADFNAQMAQLQQTVESYDNRITANATDIDTLEAIVPRSAFSATNTVQKAINDEATARDAADTALEGQIEAMRSELYYNVLDYGAKGDGTTDDTAAIQAAINACVRGGTVYFPIGRGQAYKVTSTIDITTPFIALMCDHISGVNYQTVGIRFEPSAVDSVLFNDNAEGVTFCNIVASSTIAKRGIFAHCRIPAADTDVAFYNCQVVDFHTGFQTWNRGFRLTECTCATMDVVAEISHDTYVQPSGRNTQRGIVIENNRFHDNIRGIVIDDATIIGMVIANNLLDLNYNVESLCNTLLETDDAATLYGCSIVDNVVCDYYGDAIHIGTAVNCNICNNTFMSRQMAGTNGIVIANVCQSCTLNGNSIGPTREDGIYVRQLRQSSISGNSVQYSASESQSHNHACIRIGAGFGFLINSNAITIVDSAATQSNPIVLDSIGNYTNSVIQNNTSFNQSTIVHVTDGPGTINNCKFQTTITA